MNVVIVCCFGGILYKSLFPIWHDSLKHSVLKVNIGLICGCLPTLKPILDLVRGCPKKIAYKRRELRELELTDDRHRLSVLPEEEEEEEERRERTKERERKTSSVDSIDLLYGSEEARGNRHGAWA